LFNEYQDCSHRLHCCLSCLFIQPRRELVLHSRPYTEERQVIQLHQAVMEKSQALRAQR
jgi:hypothetical protein